MRKQSIIWTKQDIFNRVPTERGCTARLANNDMVQDTGHNWVLTRNSKLHYFIEMWELVDFILKNSPKTKSRIGQI